MSNFGDMNLAQLRAECKKRGAKVDGQKRDLVERLEAYARNANFGLSPSLVEPEFNVKIPDLTTYKDINVDSPLPSISTNTLHDHLHALDASVKRLSKDLYSERYLAYCRWAPSTSSWFVRAKCYAQMKAGVTYLADVELDGNGVVQATQCECAAGMGPDAHCNHVIAVLYVLSVYKQEGGIMTEQTCTQHLQQFHAVRKMHGGSPMKAAQMKLPFGDGIVKDPRPAGRRNCSSYRSHFMNVWKACPIVAGRPVSHLFEAVNMRGVVNDHCYVGSYETNALKSLGVVSLTKKEREDIEVKTRGQAANKQWHLERSKRLQASSFGRICRLTDRTDHQAFAESLAASVTPVRSASIQHGRKYELVALRKFSELTRKEVKECGILVSEAHPYLAASPDGIVQELDGSLSVVEGKCPYAARDQLITPKTVPYLQESMSGVVLKESHEYFYQVQRQMLCSGAVKAYFVIYTFKDLVVLHIPRNDAFILTVVHKLQVFFDRYFKEVLLETYLYRTFSESAWQKRVQNNLSMHF